MTGGTVRRVHPGAWWVWAIATAAAATLTTNVLVLGLLVAATCLVVAACAEPQELVRFRLYLWVATAVVVVRVVLRCVFPEPGGTPVLELPSLTLGPLELFGTLTTGALWSALSGGAQLAAVVLAVGAAHALGDVLQLLKHAPPALAGLSTALVIAVSVFPELARSTQDVRRAARLRGGRAGVRGVVVPVLESTMERSVALAAALEARGLGARRHGEPDASRSGIGRDGVQAACVTASVLCVAFAAYGLFDDAWPRWAAPVLTGCAVTSAVVAARVDRSARRSVYRPDRWSSLSTITAASGVVCALVVALLVGPATRIPPVSAWITLSVPALLGPLLVAVPVLACLPARPASKGHR